MLHLYQDIFEGHGATGSRAFTSRSSGPEEDIMDVQDDEEYEVSGDEDESMQNSRREPSVNKSSRSIDKGKTRAGPKRTPTSDLADVVKEWVAYNKMEKQQQAAEGSSSAVDPLEKCEEVLQDMDLDPNTHAYVLHYLYEHERYQRIFLKMDASFRI